MVSDGRLHSALERQRRRRSAGGPEGFITMHGEGAHRHTGRRGFFGQDQPALFVSPGVHICRAGTA